MDVLTRPAEEFGNDETLEHLWAAKAMEHSDIYFNVLCSVDTRWLCLTPHDDLIYSHFRQDFPDMDVRKINENEIKNSANKARWRMFCEKFKNIVEDYSFGTLLRADTNVPQKTDEEDIDHRRPKQVNRQLVCHFLK
ncbi:unnamed protein product, partial [Iphiclides podalirius]